MFQIGDTVRIKDWDQLVEEFGLLHEGVIDCEFYFIEEDKDLCGTTFQITDIVSTPFCWKGLSFTDQVDHYVGHEAGHLMISADMLEIVN